MNREFFAIGMMEYGGIGLLIVLGLFVAALDLLRALFPPIANRCHVSRRRGASPKPISHSISQSERSQSNQ